LLKQGEVKLDLVIYNAGYFKRDTLEKLSFADQVQMYTVCSITPTLISSSLLSAKVFSAESIFLMITTEGGSIGLRTKEEGTLKTSDALE
jgi:short-subunit dehydrogenase